MLLNPLPQFHVGGSIFGALSPVAAGWTVVIPTPLGARNPNVVRDWWSIVERNKVTIGGAVPTSLAAIMNVPRDGHDLSSLKVFVSGGSTVPVELIRRIEREIGVPVVEGYGMTEVHCYSTMNPMHGERRPGSVGLRLPYTEVRIADVARRRHDPRRLPAGHDRPCADARPAGDAGLSRSAPRQGRDAGRRLARLRAISAGSTPTAMSGSPDARRT